MINIYKKYNNILIFLIIILILTFLYINSLNEKVLETYLNNDCNINSKIIKTNSDNFKSNQNSGQFTTYDINCNNSDDNTYLYTTISGSDDTYGISRMISDISEIHGDITDISCISYADASGYDIYSYDYDSSRCHLYNFKDNISQTTIHDNIYYNCSPNGETLQGVTDFPGKAGFTQKGYTNLKINNFNWVEQYNKYCINDASTVNLYNKITYSILDNSLDQIVNNYTYIDNYFSDVCYNYTNVWDASVNLQTFLQMDASNITSFDDSSYIYYFQEDIANSAISNSENYKLVNHDISRNLVATDELKYSKLKNISKSTIYSYLIIILIICITIITLHFIYPDLVTIEILIGFSIFLFLLIIICLIIFSNTDVLLDLERYYNKFINLFKI